MSTHDYGILQLPSKFSIVMTLLSVFCCLTVSGDDAAAIFILLSSVMLSLMPSDETFGGRFMSVLQLLGNEILIFIIFIGFIIIFLIF